MATKTFDNQGGGGDGTWETGANWDPVDVPIAGDYVVISTDCSVSTDYSAVGLNYINITATLTVANGGDIRFVGPSTPAIRGTLHIDSGGSFTTTNEDITIFGTGEIVMDGGVLTLVSTSPTIEIKVIGAISGTSNGGTINLDCAVANKSNVEISSNGSMIGNVASPLIIIGDVGASTGRLFISGAPVTVQYVDCRDCRLRVLNSHVSFVMKNCTIRGINTTLDLAIDFNNVRHVTIMDTTVDKYTTGLKALNTAEFTLINVKFGETTPGTIDLEMDSLWSQAHLYNCSLNSATPVAPASVDYSVLAREFIYSTAHDQDPEKFKAWLGPDHILESEFTIVHDASRQSLKLITSTLTTSAKNDRFDFLLAAWPATHGDTLDVALYVRGQSGDKFQVHVDPDNVYGTTQATEHTHAVNDVWEQITVPQYTVNTNAGEKMGIPIVIRCEEASKTWYIDTLEVTQA